MTTAYRNRGLAPINFLALPSVKEGFALLGVEPMPLSPSEFDALIRREIEINLSIVKAANLKFE